MCYDDENVYVAIKCYSTGKDFIVSSLKRDYGFRSNDNISLLFDTFNDNTNAFLFGINPFGARREALISNGGRSFDDFVNSWDNKWKGESKIYENYWVAEIAIPFKTLRFKDGSKRWRFNAYRNDLQVNEITSWKNIPRANMLMDLNFMGDIIWDKPLKKPGKNISLIPYLSGKVSKNHEENESTIGGFNGGADAKIAISSGLNLDLTANPDFSQVEVDQQVTNLDRFEIFFPERRQFFLENADLFGGFGQDRVNPFFSRRIGVAYDTLNEVNVQNTIYYGARLSGKVNEKMRIGLLTMQTAKQQENDLPSFMYTVAAVEQRVFQRSNIALMFVNKQAMSTEGFGDTTDPYNRVVALEYRLASADNYWTGKFSNQMAFTPNDDQQKFAHVGSLQYNRRKFRLDWRQIYVGNGMDAQVGFVPRKDYIQLRPRAEYRLFPEKGAFSQHNVGIENRWFFKLGIEEDLIREGFAFWERITEVYWNSNFRNGTRLDFRVSNNYVYLYDDFDPTRIQEDSIFLSAGTDYNFTNFSTSYNSDRRKKFSFEIRPTVGQFYGGLRAGVRGRFDYRFQPYGTISLRYNYNHIELGDNFETANLWLVGPRLDLTFSKKIFLTTFIQYNNQSDNLNINARFQWRFKPVSDFFLVYSDNYLTDPFSQFSVRNRALIAKITYWLNL